MHDDDSVKKLEQEAWSLLKQGDSDSAARTVRAAIDQVEASSGAGAPRLVSLLRLLAKAIAKPFGVKDAAAADLLLRAIEIADKQSPEYADRAGLYGQAGGALHSAGKLLEARTMQERAVELSTRMGRDVNFHLRGLSMVVADIDPREAIPLWERLLALEARDSPGSWSLMTALDGLARSLMAAGRGAEAASHWEQALKILEDRAGDTRPRWAAEFRELIERARARG